MTVRLAMIVFALLVTLWGAHAASVVHVQENGLKVSVHAMRNVVKSEHTTDLLKSLNSHEPIQLNRLPTEWFTESALLALNRNVVYASLTGDSKIRLSGATYEDIRSLGVPTPLIVIQ